MRGELRDELIGLSRAIHADPEIAYQEHRSVERICVFLEGHGHTVERGYGGLPTAFRAHAGPAGRAVALLAEYDALPAVGHGCGHNLIAMTNVGAFLLAATASDLAVGVELIGTPAEEQGGGKIDLLAAGAFDHVVAAISSHPASSPADWAVSATGLGVIGKKVTFHGAAAHAGSAPERGRNALNGVIRLFTGIDGWRQMLPGDARIHGVITDGGLARNVIPARAEAVFGLRAKDPAVLLDLIATFERIANGAALQTGTTARIETDMPLFDPVTADVRIGDLLAAELQARGVTPGRGTLVTASTDLGNVSQKLPTDWIRFPVTEEAIAGHSDLMREASRSDLAHANAL
ncbi:MAG TPA: amidohydrolase, partial [Candidatus Saccharimonadales bacterium]|nr:amidohydrolase [Candidatus Saccharimonadales bacterium]